MEATFLAAAGLGTALILCQFVMGLLGVGGDHDGDGADHDHDSNWLFGMLTFRTLAAAIAFFGLGGMSALSFGLEPMPALGIAIGSGALALYGVAMLMKGLGKLKSDGTARIDDAVGQTGTVYLRVPGEKSGPGKVHLTVQNRTVELAAVTRGNELPTGTAVKVVSVVNTGTVEVEAA